MKNRVTIITIAMGAMFVFGILPNNARASTVLWPQMGLIPGSLSAIASNTNQNIWAADDFQLTADSAITQIYWVGGRNNNLGNTPPTPIGFHIRFYENVFDTTLGRDRAADTPVYDQLVTNFSQNAAPEIEKFYTYWADLPTPFTAGGNQTYWLSVQANNNDNDPWLWLKSNSQNLNIAEFTDPTHYHDQIAVLHDLAFRLDGSPVPIPGAFWLFGSGLVGLGWLKRHKD